MAISDEFRTHTDSDGTVLTVSTLVCFDGWEVVYRSPRGNFHRLDGPAEQRFYDNGQLAFSVYNVNGKRHRVNGPACQRWHSDGKYAGESWRLNDKLHRVDGPAVVDLIKNRKTARREWWIDGKRVAVSDRLRAAADPATSPKRLARLARSVDLNIAKVAVNNPSCPEEAKAMWVLTCNGF
jgi:hypothetical protein